MQSWNQLEGKTLAGTYPLSKVLRTEGDQAWFVTRYQQKPAVAFIAQAVKDENALVANLEAACRVKHPNIVLIERVGKASIDGSSVVYAILEATEQNLAEVLRTRPLTAEETTQITQSLVGALTVLRENGLVHGRLGVVNVFAAGVTVKLRSDCLQKVPAAAKNDPETYDQDLGDLGALVFQALTQRQLTSPDDPAIAALPMPFRSIVQSSITGRWGLIDFSAALQKPPAAQRHPVAAAPAQEAVKPVEAAKPQAAAPPKTVAPAPVVEPASKDGATAKPIPGAAVAVTPAAAIPAATPAAVAAAANVTSQPSAATALDEPPAAPSRTGIRVFALLAILAVSAIGWYFYRSNQHGASSPAAAMNPAPAPDASAPAAPAATDPATTPAAPAATAPAAPAPATASSATPDVAPPASTGGKRSVWRVVVYTYDSEAAAQHRVATITRAHPDLKPEVFSPNGSRPYLVTVGGPMSREDAKQLRSQVGSEGLPGDSYTQNFSH